MGKNIKLSIVCVVCVLVFIKTVCFSQEWVSLNNDYTIQKPKCRIISSNKEETIIKFIINGFYRDTVEIDGDIYHKLFFPEYQTLNDIGKPALPIISELIGIPNNCNINLSIIDSSIILLDGYEVYPYQKPLLENEIAEKFHINRNFYFSSELFPANSLFISEPMIWRDIKNINMILAPIKWNPKNKSLYIFEEITIKIKYIYEHGTIPTITKSQHIPKRIKRMYKSHILNYDDMLFFSNTTENSKNTLKSGGSTNYNYLIITSPSYSNSKKLDELVDWVTRKGLKCEFVTTNETGTNSSDIKDYITDEYDNSNIEYVLFIGDHSDIPAHVWSGGYSAYSDYWYGCVDPGGDTDYQAEVAIGRFSISNIDELQNMISKTINYEKNPPINNWVERCLLIAHKQSAPGKYQQCKEDIRTKTRSITTPTFDKAYGAHPAQDGNDATNQTIINAINDGRGLVNYRGHGTVTGWEPDWSYEGDEFNKDEINDLTNGSETPVIFSIACHNGAIQDSDDTCLAESFTRIAQGAVSFLGATRTTWTTENHTLDKELFNHIYDSGFYNIGNVLILANIETMSKHSNNSASKLNTKAYLWCGSSSLEIWTDTQSQFANVSISDNGNSVSVNTGGVSNCNIILNSSIDDGDSYFDFAEEVSSHTFNNIVRPYYVTVTKHNYIPYLSDTYVQNKNLINRSYITGKNIYAGYDVTSCESNGNVIIKNGANVTFNAKQDVNLEGGFEVEAGGTFEVK